MLLHDAPAPSELRIMTKVAYFNIDKDDLTLSTQYDDLCTPEDDEDIVADAEERGRTHPNYGRTTVKVELDDNNNLIFTPIEPPEPTYYIKHTYDHGRSLHSFPAQWSVGNSDFIAVYEEKPNGNLEKLDDDAKARVVEQWRAGKLS